MKRSVIQLAGRTLLVSLPVKWADANNVKKGDELDIVEDGHRLTINTERTATIETAELDAEKIGPLIHRYILALYKKGIDEIKVNYSTSQTAEELREALLNETVGYEIVSQTPKNCTIKLITHGSITEFDNLLRRTFLLLLSMSEETLNSIKNKDYEHLSKTAMLEATNNRLTTICRRSLNKWGSDTYQKIGPIYYIVEELENIADEYKYFCNNLYELYSDKKDMTIRPEIISLLEKTNNVFREFYELFYKFDLAKFTTVSQSRKKILNEAKKYFEKKLTPAEMYVLHHTMILIERYFCITGPFLILMN